MSRAAPDPRASDPQHAPRPLALRIALGGAGVLLFALFIALGTWQVERRTWKLALIDRVEQRVHAAPAAAPGVERWPLVGQADDEYRHVRLDGRYLHDKETLVQATTDLGSGYWVLTPLQQADGSIVLVNRGFVPPDRRDRATRREDEPAGPTTVTGLLRMTEPKGALLRRNDPGQERWYSRDVQAIALARGLGSVAPYFVDADAAPMPVGERAPNARRWPAGGLTVVSFNNNHLSYAITWYVLALMVAFAAWHAQREGRRRRDAASALAEDGKGEGSGHGAGR